MKRSQGRCDVDTTCESSSTLLAMYLFITCAAAAASVANRCLWALVGLRAATKLHDCMTVRLLYSTQAAVETIPVGQFLSRFGSDIDVLDSKVWVFASVAAASFLDMCMKVALLVSVIPASFVCFLVLVWMYNRVQQKYMLASIVFRRANAASKAEVYVAVSESLQCAETWRSFEKLQHRQACLAAALQEYNKMLFYATFLNRWLGIRVEAIGAGALFVVAIFVVIFARDFEPSTAGLAMSQVLLLNQLLTSFVREAADCVTSFNSIERCMSVTHLPLEGATSASQPISRSSHLPIRSFQSLRLHVASIQLARRLLLSPDGIGDTTMNAASAVKDLPPSSGGPRVVFERVSFRYSPEGDWILKDVSLGFSASKSYGICGRSGSGKSTLVAALLRLVPMGAECFNGKIEVDGHDVARLSLVRIATRLIFPFVHDECFRCNCAALWRSSLKHARCSTPA
jgi:ATP-binding cassette subfamily C (CFTR/MRP) protein 1